MICDQWDVVAVPFPFSDRPGSKRRPALALSGRRFNRAGHTILCMITSKSAPSWPHDHPLADHNAAGLPSPCLVRFKLFTLDNRLILCRLGRLGDHDRAAIARHLQFVINQP